MSRSGLGLVVISALGAACWSPPDRIADLRPLTLQVLSARSKHPVEGVPVIYVVQTRVLRDRFLGFIPSLEPTKDSRVAVALHGTTDAQGEVTFRVQGLAQPGNEEWDSEFAFVNVGVEPRRLAKRQLAAIPKERQSSLSAPEAGPSDGHIGWFILQDKEERRQAFWNPVTHLRGVVLIKLFGGRGGGDYTDWSEREDCFRIRFDDGDARKASERVVIELENQ